VKLLVLNGADMFLKNHAGKDAVWEAEQRGNDELVGWLLAFGEERGMGEVTEEDIDVDEKDEMNDHEESILNGKQ
jgi:hypothetical protein